MPTQPLNSLQRHAVPRRGQLLFWYTEDFNRKDDGRPSPLQLGNASSDTQDLSNGWWIDCET